VKSVSSDCLFVSRVADVRSAFAPIASFQELLQLQAPPMSTVKSSPEISDTSCARRTLTTFNHDGVTMSEADRAELSDSLLASIGLDQYVSFVKSDTKVSNIVPFDVSSHVDAQTHVAKELLARLEKDLKTYAAGANDETQAKLVGLLDADLARITQVEKEDVKGDASIEASINKTIAHLCELVKTLERVREVDQIQIPLAVTSVINIANTVPDDDKRDNADTHKAKQRFLAARYSGQESEICRGSSFASPQLNSYPSICSCVCIDFR
jgi:hypothetical protein